MAYKMYFNERNITSIMNNAERSYSEGKPILTKNQYKVIKKMYREVRQGKRVKVGLTATAILAVASVSIFSLL